MIVPNEDDPTCIEDDKGYNAVMDALQDAKSSSQTVNLIYTDAGLGWYFVTGVTLQ